MCYKNTYIHWYFPSVRFVFPINMLMLLGRENKKIKYDLPTTCKEGIKKM